MKRSHSIKPPDRFDLDPELMARCEAEYEYLWRLHEPYMGVSEYMRGVNSGAIFMDKKLLAIKPGVPYLPNSKEELLSDPDWRAWLEKS